MAESNWQNRTLFHGDNLEFMRAMNSESVDLIATDPPFNKGKDFHATPDSLAKGASFQDRWSWEEEVHNEWVSQLPDNWPKVWEVINSARESWGDDMGAFLCFMAVRLIAMRRLLKPTGAIYLHCDPTASHYLKMLMDAIFGKDNFRNEIKWVRTSGAKLSQHAPKRWGRSTDIILFYSKTKQHVVQPFRELTQEEAENKFEHRDGRGRYFTKGMSIWCRPSHGARPNLCYKWRGFENPHPSGWTLSKERLEEEYQKGNIVIDEKGRIERRKYEEDYPGVPTNDTWSDIPNLTGKDKERTGYPTQKPLALYERIIQASSGWGSVVLDPFCGCATTCVAAEKLKRQWVGIDIWPKVQDVVVDRLEQEGLIAPKYTRKTTSTRAQYLWAEELYFTNKLPVRTDDGKTDTAYLAVKEESILEGWQRISKQKVVELLKHAQWHEEKQGVVCGGCGRVLELPFMHLDHIRPRSGGGPNDISNRVLLCAPCNIRKKDDLTMPGLRKINIKTKWMQDDALAKAAQIRAENCAITVRRTYPNFPELTDSLK